jgi:MFS family permease
VWIAPLLTGRLRRTTVLATVLPLLAIDLVVAGLLVTITTALISCVIVGGLMLGVLNTVLTESVMDATDLPRSVASSSYSAVRFLGGAAAPPLATTLAAIGTPALPFFVSGASVLLAAVLIFSGQRALGRINGAVEAALDEAEDIGLGDAA